MFPIVEVLKRLPVELQQITTDLNCCYYLMRQGKL